MKPHTNYSEAFTMRMQGKTYGEIKNALGIAKSTQSNWFKKLALPDHAKDTLAQKQCNGLKALQIFNTNRTIAIQKENEQIRKTYEEQIQNLNRRELALIGAALYWAEGYKNFNQAKNIYPYIGFANSDPQMIILFMHFLSEILDIKPQQIRGKIHIYPKQSKEQAIQYWQQVSGIPLGNIKTYILVSRTSQGKRPKNLLPYGTFYIVISRRQGFFKIKGLIDGIIKAYITT